MHLKILSHGRQMPFAGDLAGDRSRLPARAERFEVRAVDPDIVEQLTEKMKVP